MKGMLFLLVALISLVVWALIDLALSMPGGMPRVPMEMTDRLRLASAATVLFSAFNFILVRTALVQRSIPPWATTLIAVLGAVGVLYLPAWSLGLPWLSPLLSTRHNLIWRVLQTGGLISLTRLQLAGFLVLGVVPLLRRSRRSPAEAPLDAA
jgi:hypothetical protein